MTKRPKLHALPTEPRPWPFYSPLMDRSDAEPEDDSPYCECDLTPTMAEADRGKCAACGKPLA